jgi:hypothetical protein
MAGRKCGSNVLAGITGVALLALGSLILGRVFAINLKAHPEFVNGGACILFGVVLSWWTLSEGKRWGIGFETVGMTVGVVTAVIAILTLTAPSS